MLGAAMQAPLAGLALTLELTHRGFAIMIPMIAATVTATAVARYVDGYSIYSAPAGRPAYARVTPAGPARPKSSSTLMTSRPRAARIEAATVAR